MHFEWSIYLMMGQKSGQEEMVMPRRGENIRKRKDGRWEGRYSACEPQSGKRVIYSVYARNYSEAKQKLAAAKVAAIAEKQLCTKKVMFQTAAEEWLAQVKNSKKYSTFVKYSFIYEKHIKDSMKNFILGETDETMLIQAFQNELKKEISESLQKSMICVINQILSYATANYHIEKIKYSFQCCKRSIRPAGVLSQTEQTLLLRCLYHEMDIYKLGIVICISTGLRLGEICALKWSDIHLERKILQVNSTVQRIRVDGRNTQTVLLEGEPKSMFSKREIPLSDEIIQLLHSYYHGVETYVINDDSPMDPRTYQNKFKKYLQTAGIEYRNFHSLRHTFATNCINSGADVKSLSEILGHSDVKTTLNRYMHPTIETKRQYMNSLSSIYGQYMGQTVS